MQSIRLTFPDYHQGRAQALYSSLSFGAGGTVGCLISGYTWDYAGAQITYLWAALICFIAVWICWQYVGHRMH
jgi:PPP family 3-phenylpropionic acid transporter